MGDEPTVEELKAIVKKFMLNAPPGEFMEVVTDIRGLVEDESIINDVVPDAFQHYNVDQMLTVDNGDHKVIICKDGQVSSGEYLDAVSKEIVSFDHITRKVTGAVSANQQFSGKFEDQRCAIQTELENYVADHYATGVGHCFNTNEGVVIVISAAKYEPRNFWTGSWRAVWKVAIKGADVTCTGKINCNVHFYEDGNVQLNASNTLEAKVKGGNSPDALATAIFKAIETAESKYQGSVDAAYNQMDTSTFKALRRQLPVTATKIDWDKIAHSKIQGFNTKE